MGVSGDSKLYLAGFGLSRRSYYRDYFIYRYGIPEDVPAGSILQFLIGFENALASNRLYTGVNAALGNHFGKFGYVSLSAGYGNFWNHGNVEQGVVSTSIGYFSNLITIGNWKLRQFAKGSIIYGVKRRVGEVVDINEENGIKGFVGVIPDVTNKIVFNSSPNCIFRIILSDSGLLHLFTGMSVWLVMMCHHLFKTVFIRHLE